jgi:hypothetical protein
MHVTSNTREAIIRACEGELQDRHDNSYLRKPSEKRAIIQGRNECRQAGESGWSGETRQSDVYCNISFAIDRKRSDRIAGDSCHRVHEIHHHSMGQMTDIRLLSYNMPALLL